MELRERFLHFSLIVIVAIFSLHIIGCDGVAGSHRRLDRCGVCGGDNSTCRVVSGIFTRPQLTVGYNVVAHIPKSACNLNITQLKKSANRLAIRKNDGTFIINGDWRVSWPGVYEDGAGTKFHYSRQDPTMLESIVAPGPLNEPVDLMVVYQQPNHGIKYEYTLPSGDASIPNLDPLSLLGGGRQLSAATYRPTAYAYINGPLPNNANAFNSISSFPKHPNASPGGSPTLLYPGDSALNHNTPPFENQIINPQLNGIQGKRKGQSGSSKSQLATDKKFFWKTIVRCVKPPSTPVSDRRCLNEEKPVSSLVRCNVKPCPAEWDVGTWSPCSEQCGDGVKTRTVFCQQKISPTLTMRVAEGACLKGKPETEEKCFIRPCHRYETTEWSQCSAKCGNGIRRRSVICLDSRGKKIKLEDCDDAERPTEILPCNMSPCDGTNIWFASEWSSKCSQNCGNGVQTRNVVCGNESRNFTGRRRPLSSEEETNSIEDADQNEDEDSLPPVFHCDESKKPEKERHCFNDKDCEDPTWFTGGWSECSSLCGNGLKTRQVLCVLFSRGHFKVVEDNLCSQSTKPEEKVVCDSARHCSPKWFTTDWSECSAFCGGGTQKRSVSCRSGNWTKTSSFCADTERPLDKRSCNEQKCSKTTDTIGMVKDTSPTSLLSSPVEWRNASSFSTIGTNATKVQPSKTPSIIVQEVEDSECTDQYRNCPLVVQARLCRYRYYRSQCCNACNEAHHEFKN